MQKIYSRIDWKNFPSEETAVNETNLNRMDSGLDAIDDRVVAMDATKFDVITANSLIKDWEIDEKTGIITITKLSGEKILFDLNIEKIPVSFALSDDGILTMTTDDGTKFTANIGAMIPILTFEDSDEIAVSVSGEGVNKTYSFSIKNGSITEDKLRPDYLADIKVESAKAEKAAEASTASQTQAQMQATLAKSYAEGDTGRRDGEDTNNAKYWAQLAQSAVGIKADGVTIVSKEDGTLTAVAEDSLDEESELPPKTKVVAAEIRDLKNNLSSYMVKNPLTKVYFNYGSYFPGSSFEESAHILAGYDLICCEGSISGWTDSEKRQNEMALVQEVRRRNPNVKFFRYISVKNKYDATSKTRVPINKYDLYQQIRATLHMGGTWTTDKDADGYDVITGGIPYDGIFWDDFDSLSGVTELNDGDEQSWESVLEKQNDVIEEARRLGLCSFGNAWHVIELVSGKPIDNEPYYNPKSLKSSIGENDYLMVESWVFFTKEPGDGFGFLCGVY